MNENNPIRLDTQEPTECTNRVDQWKNRTNLLFVCVLANPQKRILWLM